MYIITTTCASKAFLFAEISEDEFTKYTNLLRRASNKYILYVMLSVDADIQTQTCILGTIILQT